KQVFFRFLFSMIQNLKVLSRLKGVLLFLLIAIGIYFLFIKKDKTIEVSKKDPSQVKKKAALKRGIASVSEDPLKAKNFKKIQTPISQKKISENAESLFSENYREQDEPIGDAVVDENAIRRGETEMAPYYPAAVAGAK